MDYPLVAEMIVNRLNVIFPSSDNFFSNNKNRDEFITTLSSAMRRRNMTGKHAKRIMHWAEEYDSNYLPSLGVLMGFTETPTPEQREKMYHEQNIVTEKKTLKRTESELKTAKDSIARMMKSLGGKNV